MAEQEKLIVEFSAETVGLVKSIATVENRLEDFGKVGETSLGQISAAFSVLNKARKTATDPAQIIELNKALAELAAKGKDIRDLGLKGITDITDSSKKARVAVYGLTQVVRDLPFGFIAISNNIPVLFDQLAALRKETGSTSGALSAFAKGIFSSGGVILAFSVLSSYITNAVQKYGSLSKALNETFNLLDSATRAQILLNEALDKGVAGVTGEITELTTLVNILTDFNKTDSIRLAAYDELIKKRPEAIAGLTKEAALTREGAAAIKSQADELSKLIVLQGSQKAIINLIEKEQEKIFTAQRERNNYLTGDGITSLDVFIRSFETAAKRLAKLDFTPTIGLLPQDPLGTKELTQDIDKSQTAIESFRKEYVKLTETALGFKKQTKSQKELEDEARKAAQLKQKIETLQIQRKIQLLKDSLRYLPLESAEYAKIIDQVVLLEGQLKKISEEDVNIKAQIDIDTNINRQKAKKDLQDAIIKTGGVEVLQREFKKVQLEIEPQIKLKKGLEGIKNEVNARLLSTQLDIPFNVKFAENQIKQFIENGNANFQQLQELAKGISGAIGNIFGNLVTDISNGKNAVDSLTDAFKDLAKQLAVALVKFALFKAIEAGLAASTGGTSKIATGFLGDFLGFTFGGGRIKAGGAGLSVGEGGLAMAGQVTFVQRGPDLVGVLQRANGRINRVG